MATLETGSYAKAAAYLQAATKSKNDEAKTVAKDLYALVKADLTKLGKAAWGLGNEGSVRKRIRQSTLLRKRSMVTQYRRSFSPAKRSLQRLRISKIRFARARC